MKDAFYFSHDSNARNDEKILRLRAEFGWEGYGLFWALVEWMRDAEGYRISRDLLPEVARTLGVRAPKLVRFVDRTVALQLFSGNSTHVWSDSLERRMREWDDYRAQQSEFGKRGAAKRYANSRKPDRPPDDPTDGEPIGYPSENDRVPHGVPIAKKRKERIEDKERERDARASGARGLDHIPGEWSSELEAFYGALIRWGRSPDAAIRETIRLLRNPRGHPQGARIGDGKIYNGYSDQEILDAIEALAMAGHWAPKVLVKHVAKAITDKDDGGKDGQRRTTSAGAKGSTSHERRMGLELGTIADSLEKFKRSRDGTPGDRTPDADPDLDGRVAVGGDR